MNESATMAFSPFAVPHLAETRKLVDAVDTARFAPFWTRPARAGEWHGLSSLLQSFLFAHALGMNFRNPQNRRTILWPQDLDEIAFNRRRANDCPDAGQGKRPQHDHRVAGRKP